MLATLNSIEDALATQKGSDSWNLHLDKLCFEREAADAGAKNLTLSRIKNSWQHKAAIYLKDAAERQARWLGKLNKQHGSRFRAILLSADSRLLLHLGRASVLENVGLYSDRTTGLPLIPGTSLKGVINTWAAWDANTTSGGYFNEGDSFVSMRQADARHVLGDNSDAGSQGSGEIIFVGGFPAEPNRLPRLEFDIVTPHPDNGRGRILPNIFLAWGSGALWRFVILARPGARDAVKLLDLVEQWLIEALTQVGLGAKTAAGYGRFRLLDADERERIRKLDDQRVREEQQCQERIQHEAELAQLSPEEQAYARYVANQKDWVAAAREIAARPEPERQWILRYFRTASGQSLLKSWTNEKGKKRIENLKAAGL